MAAAPAGGGDRLPKRSQRESGLARLLLDLAAQVVDAADPVVRAAGVAVEIGNSVRGAMLRQAKPGKWEIAIREFRVGVGLADLETLKQGRFRFRQPPLGGELIAEIFKRPGERLMVARLPLAGD